MAYTYTLQDAINEGAFGDISGVCPTSDEFKSLLNQAQRRIAKRGNWFGTEMLVNFCIYNGCLVLPRYIGTLMGVRFCDGTNPDILNHWYAIVGPCDCQFASSHTVTEIGTAPAYNEISGDYGKYIRYYVDKLEDVGKTITIYGIDSNGQPLQELVGGVWQRGITLTAAAPFAQTTAKVRRITSVTREATQANARLYEVDPILYDADATPLVPDTTEGYMRDLALYEPSETNPRYRKYFIKGFDSISTSCSESDGITLRKVTALVKLQFVPVVSLNDFLMIDDFDAIKLMIRAIRQEDAGNDEGAEALIMKSVREMNFTERDKLPNRTTVVRVNAVGGYLGSPI